MESPSIIIEINIIVNSPNVTGHCPALKLNHILIFIINNHLCNHLMFTMIITILFYHHNHHDRDHQHHHCADTQRRGALAQTDHRLPRQDQGQYYHNHDYGHDCHRHHHDHYHHNHDHDHHFIASGGG